MALDFRAHMFGGNKRKINNQPVIDAMLHGSTASLRYQTVSFILCSGNEVFFSTAVILKTG